MIGFNKLLIGQVLIIITDKVNVIVLFLLVKQNIEKKTEQMLLAKFIDKVGS